MKFRAAIAIALIMTTVNTPGQQPEEQTDEIPESGNPEYRIKSLPTDSFKPSEKISEDFPVPFPVDI